VNKNKKVNFKEKKLDDNKTSLDKLLKKKFEKHYLALNISKLHIAFKPSSRMDFSISKFGKNIHIFMVEFLLKYTMNFGHLI
jgi:hypothetical protein